MAARRLLILMLAVLAVSTVAAALVAPPPEPEPAPTTTDDPVAGNSLRTGAGRLIEAEMNTSGRRPERIRLRPGDQAALTVRSHTGRQVEIPAFGLIEDVGRDDPARFNLLAERPGTFEVRLVSSGRVIGRIAVVDDGPGGGHG